MTNKKRLTTSILCLLMLIVSMFAFSACGGGKVENFNLSFKVDGENYSTISTNGSEIIAIPENPSKEGYTFDGWYWDKDVWNEPFTANSLLNAPISSDMSVYAKFNAISYDITYETDNGTHSNPVSYTIEDSFALSDAEKNGYNFVGWYSDNDYTTEVTSISAGSMGAITLYAKYEVATYSITYENAKDATNNNVTSYTIESSTITLENLEKLGYTFDGWYNNGTKITEIAAGSTGNLVLTAQWTPVSYSITYENTKDATNNNVTSYTIESSTITLENLEKLGYTFDGWYNNGMKITEIVAGSTGNLVLTAQWTPIGYEIKYHNIAEATHSNPDVYDVEDQPLALSSASKTGYTFTGWYTDSACQNKITEVAIGTTGELNLYAGWEIIEYTATFKDGNDTVEEITFTVETETINEPSVPTHNGYNGKWADYVLGTSDITINAEYTPIVYTITYENTKDATNNNVTSYTIESATITLENIAKLGYTFDGWYNNGTKVTEIAAGSTGNLVLTAQWTAIQYNITYMYDDAIGDYVDSRVNPNTYTVEDDFEFIGLVNKTTGYTFDGWYTEKNTGTGSKVAGISLGSTGDITIYAHWALDEYTITYHNASGITNTNATSYTIETDTFSIYDISKEGYVFNGWHSDSNLTTKVTEIAKGTTGNIDLYAKWTPIEYTIEYILYGGTYDDGKSNPTSYTIETIYTFAEPTLAGYVFGGWYTSADYLEGIEKVEGNIGNITLYAKWVHISTITFVTNGGNIVTSISAPAGTILNLPDAEKDYYDFATWYTDSALTNEFTSGIMPNDDVTLYAKYTPTVYTITYVLNDGVNAEDAVMEYTYEDTITLPIATKTGHSFVGWFTNAQFTSSVVSELKNSHGDITLYANYSINKYTISFDTNGGTEVEPITQNYNTSVSAPSSPAKNGYRFAGWYSDISLNEIYEFTAMPATDITLYAKWELENYNIIYNLSGGINNSNNPSTFTIESADIILQNPQKVGYNFAGWYSDSEYKNPVDTIENGTYNNVEVFAKWEIITYNITYVMDENAINENAVQYTVETDLAYLADANLKGHTFGGWYKDSSFNTRVYQIGGGDIGNITLYAKFTANTYNVWLDGTEEAKADVSFDLNGASGSIPTQTITESTTLVYPTIPTRSGYVFGGWYSNKECTGDLYDFTALITSDITLYAKWVEAESSIAVNSNVTVTLNGREEQKFTFVPLVSGNVTFTTTGDYDTLGILYDANGNVLKMDDDTGSDGVNFQIVFNVTAGEVYTIAVRSYSSATSGTATLYVSGSEEVTAGGYVITGNKTQIIYGSDFTIDIPSAKEGYKFLGWADKNGTMYTDETGVSVKAWDKDETTLLVSVWERTVYTITFVTSGGSAIDTVSLAYGERLDISKYVTTRDNYTFDCWMIDGVAFNATTMPDHNITLTAKWKTFSLGEIKYDETKLAISVNDEITADLFGAICIDTNGNKAEFTVTVNGTQTEGETITVRLVATSGGKTKQITITGIKVYGSPSLTFDETVDYVNISGGLTASHFNAIGIDSFGEYATIEVAINGEYEAGDIVTVVIKAIDVAGNVTEGYVKNVRVYGLPEIKYNEEKTAISVGDTLNAELFGAASTDSFGEMVDVSVEVVDVTAGFVNGAVYSYYTSTAKDYVYFTALNDETYTLHYKNGESSDRTYIMVYCVTTDNIIKSAQYYTNYSSYSTLTFSVNEGYEYYICTYAYSSSYATDFSMYLTSESKTLGAGATATIRISATDVKGNVRSINVECKVYGAPTISDILKTDIKVSDIITPSLLGITANDTFGEKPTLSITVKEGVQKAGEIVIVTATATDMAGNTTSKDFYLKIYGTPEITYDKDAVKATDNATISAPIIVSFDLNGGNGNVYSQVVTATTGLTYPNVIPTREGYSFRGWYTSAECAELYDFSKDISENITLYAGWKAMVSDGYYSKNYIDIYSGYNNSSNCYSFSNQGSSSSEQIYTYFTALKDGTYTLYYKNSSSSSSYGTYMYVYNVTQGTVIRSNSNIYSTSYASVSFEACGGDVICVRNYSDYSNSRTATFYMYVSGASLPNDGGISSNAGATAVLNATAQDSFGNKLDVSVTQNKNQLVGGTYVIYTLTATDIAGNTYSIDTDPIAVYDKNDITLSYSMYASDIVKLDSDGSEFGVVATDSFGEKCKITIEAADGSKLVGGITTSIVIVATDAAGNRVVSDVIDDIKIYDLPTVVFENDGYYVEAGADLSFMFVVYDSFGEELYANISYSGIFEGGNIISVVVTATDDANNSISNEYKLHVVSSDNKQVDLYIDNTLWKSVFVTTEIEVPQKDGYIFYGWRSSDGQYYSYEDGIIIIEFEHYIKLHAVFYLEGYLPISTVEDLKSITMSEKYMLVNDIDLGAVNWTPLSSEASPFEGVFDGNGYTISNFKFAPYLKHIGLFGYNSGTICNLRVENFTIPSNTYSGVVYAGGLVSYNAGTISNCYANGTVKPSMRRSSSSTGGRYNDYLYTGVLTGYNTGIIEDCKVFGSNEAYIYSTADISTATYIYNLYSGGLAGYNNGEIVRCISSANVLARIWGPSGELSYLCYIYAGGLVGYNYGGSINSCFAEGSVTTSGSCASAYTGGLGGYNTGNITNSYATGEVVSSAYSVNYAGGLVGWNTAIINNCYATGNVSGVSTNSGTRNGGLVGWNYDGGSVVNCFATGDVNSTASSSYASVGRITGYNTGTVKNSYYSDLQITTVSGSSTGTTRVGTVASVETFQSVLFCVQTLGLPIEYWSVAENTYPTLLIE